MRTAMPWLPDLHTPEEDRAFFAAELASSQAWVATDADDVVGFAVLQDGWLRHLYVDPDHQGRGIGTALLDAVLVECAGVGVPAPPTRPTPAHSSRPVLQLWAFQRNAYARAFYRARGFVEVERTDGSGNAEREPDVRLVLG